MVRGAHEMDQLNHSVAKSRGGRIQGVPEKRSNVEQLLEALSDPSLEQHASSMRDALSENEVTNLHLHDQILAASIRGLRTYLDPAEGIQRRPAQAWMRTLTHKWVLTDYPKEANFDPDALLAAQPRRYGSMLTKGDERYALPSNSKMTESPVIAHLVSALRIVERNPQIEIANSRSVSQKRAPVVTARDRSGVVIKKRPPILPRISFIDFWSKPERIIFAQRISPDASAAFLCEIPFRFELTGRGSYMVFDRPRRTVCEGDQLEQLFGSVLLKPITGRSFGELEKVVNEAAGELNSLGVASAPSPLDIRDRTMLATALGDAGAREFEGASIDTARGF